VTTLQIAAIGVLLVAVVGLVVVWALWQRSRAAARRLLANAEKEARRITARAEIDGQRIQKDTEILVRERLLAARTEFERETRDHRVELAEAGKDLDDKAEELAEKGAQIEDREKAVVKLEAEFGERDEKLTRAESELDAAITEQRSRLEQISSMTMDQAKGE
jgi:ribonuclease Y